MEDPTYLLELHLKQLHPALRPPILQCPLVVIIPHSVPGLSTQGKACICNVTQGVKVCFHVVGGTRSLTLLLLDLKGNNL